MNIPVFMVSDILNNTLSFQKELDEKHGSERIKNLAICMEMAARLPGKIEREVFASKIKELFFGKEYECDVLGKIEKQHEQIIGKKTIENE